MYDILVINDNNRNKKNTINAIHSNNVEINKHVNDSVTKGFDDSDILSLIDNDADIDASNNNTISMNIIIISAVVYCIIYYSHNK